MLAGVLIDRSQIVTKIEAWFDLLNRNELLYNLYDNVVGLLTALPPVFQLLTTGIQD